MTIFTHKKKGSLWLLYDRPWWGLVAENYYDATIRIKSPNIKDFTKVGVR